MSTSLSCGRLVQRRHDRPAVHLALVDLLRGRDRGPTCRRGRPYWRSRTAGRPMRPNHPVLVEAASACPTLRARAGSRTSHRDGRRHIRRSRGRYCSAAAQGRMPSRNSVTCLPSLMTIASLPMRSMRNVAVEIDAHEGPVEPSGNLLDMRRLAGAVIAAIMTRRFLAKPARSRASSGGRKYNRGRDPHVFGGGRIGRGPPCRNSCRTPADRDLHVGQTGHLAGSEVVVCISPPCEAAGIAALGQWSGPRRGCALRAVRRQGRQMAEPLQASLADLR